MTRQKLHMTDSIFSQPIIHVLNLLTKPKMLHCSIKIYTFKVRIHAVYLKKNCILERKTFTQSVFTIVLEHSMQHDQPL